MTDVSRVHQDGAYGRPAPDACRARMTSRPDLTGARETRGLEARCDRSKANPGIEHLKMRSTTGAVSGSGSRLRRCAPAAALLRLGCGRSVFTKRCEED